MQSPNKRKPTRSESVHIERVKGLPCSVCNAPGPSDAHEVKQGQWWTAIALCQDCHTGTHNGWHGRRSMWKVNRIDDELDALAITIERLFL